MGEESVPTFDVDFLWEDEAEVLLLLVGLLADADF